MANAPWKLAFTPRRTSRTFRCGTRTLQAQRRWSISWPSGRGNASTWTRRFCPRSHPIGRFRWRRTNATYRWLEYGVAGTLAGTVCWIVDRYKNSVVGPLAGGVCTFPPGNPGAPAPIVCEWFIGHGCNGVHCLEGGDAHTPAATLS